MSSSFTWLDYSEQHRQRMLDVIDLFAERETRDELGIGSIRDAFADQFFPGVSVVQTRARYLLFIPWIYRDLEQRGIATSQVAARARCQETALINVLAESEDRDGTIGIQSREKLQRLPSSVYWQALRRLGIRLFPGHQDAYHRSFDSLHVHLARHRGRERGEPSGEAVPLNWHPGLPAAPEDFPTSASLRLRRAEAKYLQERILSSAPGTLLAFLVDRGRPWQDTHFPWQHPQFGEFPERIQEQLRHARAFAETIHGAALLYNLLLAEQDNRIDLLETYRSLLHSWGEEVDAQAGFLARWDRLRFWEVVAAGNGRVGASTQLFVNRWLGLALVPGATLRIAANPDARQLIRMREQHLKGPLARLASQRALERWNGDSGSARLSYRWFTAQRIVHDVLEGLAREESDA